MSGDAADELVLVSYGEIRSSRCLCRRQGEGRMEGTLPGPPPQQQQPQHQSQPPGQQMAQRANSASSGSVSNGGGGRRGGGGGAASGQGGGPQGQQRRTSGSAPAPQHMGQVSSLNDWQCVDHLLLPLLACRIARRARSCCAPVLLILNSAMMLQCTWVACACACPCRVSF